MTEAVFPRTPPRRGLYESFYLRAVSPDEPLGAWIRYTVHKPPGAAPRGSVWCTIFDARRPAPFVHKETTHQLAVPDGSWVAVGGSRIAPGAATGSCGEARWSLCFGSDVEELHHLGREWLYRAPLPRTKLTSLAPAARFDGTIELAGRGFDVHGWPGMVGHNWGSEHAERWIWLHGIGFDADPSAWIDVALGRVRLGGRTTPWIASGAVSFGGRRLRLGGLGTRGVQVEESVRGCTLTLPGRRGARVDARVDVPEGTGAAWRYADPDGGEHDVVNCSIAALALVVRPRGEPATVLDTAHGAAYELGMRERDHGMLLAPFRDN